MQTIYSIMLENIQTDGVVWEQLQVAWVDIMGHMHPTGHMLPTPRIVHIKGNSFHATDCTDPDNQTDKKTEINLNN